MTARAGAGSTESYNATATVHEHSVRCGFRDFRFENGAFRLNGKRIYLRCSHTGNCCPIGLEMPHDPDYPAPRSDQRKMMRFNAIRFIAGVPKRYQLDLADEIGLMVYPEAYAGWCLADSPKMAERYDESVLRHDPPRPEPPVHHDVGPAERDARRAGLPPRRRACCRKCGSWMTRAW